MKGEGRREGERKKGGKKKGGAREGKKKKETRERSLHPHLIFSSRTGLYHLLTFPFLCSFIFFLLFTFFSPRERNEQRLYPGASDVGQGVPHTVKKYLLPPPLCSLFVFSLVPLLSLSLSFLPLFYLSLSPSLFFSLAHTLTLLPGQVLLVTTHGDVDVELWCKEVPLATRNFIQLCLEGYYDNTIFHRIVKGRGKKEQRN